MRVAILHYTKPPVVGGVERVVEEQSQALAALGHEVSVIDRANWPAARSGILGGATDAVIVHNVFTMPFDLEWTRELAQLAEETRSIRWVNWVHDVAAVNPAYCHLGWRETPPRALHVAVSEIRAREWAGVSGLNAEQVEIIPNGIDPARVLSLPARIADLANQSDLWQSNLLLFHPARLVRRKNVELGIQLVDALRAQGVDARLIITGAPDPHQGDGRRYFEELSALVRSLDLGRQVMFAGDSGSLAFDEVTALYRLCDALFFPSHGEGFGLPLLEAELNRLPVWCSDLAVHKAIAGPGAQFFKPQTGAKSLARRMLRWLDGNKSLAARRRIWREHSWAHLCKDRLVPLLETGNREP